MNVKEEAEKLIKEALKPEVNLLLNIEPSEFPTSYQVMPNSVEAWQLHAANRAKRLKTGDSIIPNGLVFRHVLSYDEVSKAAHGNPTPMLNKVFNHIQTDINSMSTITNLKGREVTILRPGSGEILREIEGNSGYELRVVLLPKAASNEE